MPHDNETRGSTVEPLVSVGVVTYNRPSELRRTLRYLSAQTYPNLEIIISDNGSADPRVSEVAEEFVQRDRRARFVRHPQNIGPAGNFLFVLNEARGDYFMWWSDDDHRDARYIQALLETLRAQPRAVLAFSDFNLVDAQGAPLSGYRHRRGALKAYASPSRLRRSAAYFLQHPELQKQNSIYGLFRRQPLVAAGLGSPSSTLARMTDDQVFIYEVLQLGSMALCPEQLMSLTAGNPKHYEAKSRPGKTLAQKLYAELRDTCVEAARALHYMPVTAGWPKIGIALLVPVKWASLFLRLLVGLPIRIVRARLVA